MEQEIEKKSNRKIHIIFAIFTLLLSFGISFVSVDAFSTAGELSLSKDEFNEILITYPYYIKSYSSIRTDDGGVIEQTQYYFSKTPLKFIKKENDRTYLINDDVTSYRSYSAQNRYDKNGGIDEKYPDYTWSFKKGSDYKELFISDPIVFKDKLVHSNFVFEGVQLSPEDFPIAPVAEVATMLPEVVTVNSQVIIGGTICLMALMIFLVVLAKHLRAVSQDY